MNNNSQRTNRLIVAALTVAGIVLLTIWGFSLFAYGYEVDEQGGVAELRVEHVLLAAGGAACLVAAVTLAVVQRRRSLRRTTREEQRL